jgi:hypothetical protein
MVQGVSIQYSFKESATFITNFSFGCLNKFLEFGSVKHTFLFLLCIKVAGLNRPVAVECQHADSPFRIGLNAVA